MQGASTTTSGEVDLQRLLITQPTSWNTLVETYKRTSFIPPHGHGLIYDGMMTHIALQNAYAAVVAERNQLKAQVESSRAPICVDRFAPERMTVITMFECCDLDFMEGRCSRSSCPYVHREQIRSLLERSLDDTPM